MITLRGITLLTFRIQVCDYFWTSGNITEFLSLLRDVRTILYQQVEMFDLCLEHNCDYAFVGWDDRVGTGGAFRDAAGGEAFKVFTSLIVQAVKEVADCLYAAGQPTQAAEFGETAHRLELKIRAQGGGRPWHEGYGLHAAAHAINARITTRAELEILVPRLFNDSVTICSLSPFNTFYIVQAPRANSASSL